MDYINTSGRVNNSEHFDEYIGEKNFNGIDIDLCEEGIKELQTRKLGVLITISILTLLSNMAILLAIISRPGKVRFEGGHVVAKLSQVPALLDRAKFSLILGVHQICGFSSFRSSQRTGWVMFQIFNMCMLSTKSSGSTR